MDVLLRSSCLCEYTDELIELLENEGFFVKGVRSSNTHLFLITDDTYSVSELIDSSMNENINTILVVVSDGLNYKQIKRIIEIGNEAKNSRKGVFISHFMYKHEGLKYIAKILNKVKNKGYRKYKGGTQ